MKNIAICMAAYGGAVQAACVLSLLDLHDLLTRYGVPHSILFRTNESLVTRVRNHFADIAAFDSDSNGQRFSHLLFIDSDSVFDAKDVWTLLRSGKEIAALPFAVKKLNWESIAQAKPGMPGNLLEQFGGDPNINTINLKVDGTLEPVDQVGAGLMLIDRRVLDAMVAAWPHRMYKLYPSEVGEVSADGSKRDYGFEFFRSGIDSKTQRYLSEDFAFIEDAKSLGFSPHVLSSAATGHIGKYEYQLNLRLQNSSGIDPRKMFKQV